MSGAVNRLGRLLERLHEEGAHHDRIVVVQAALSFKTSWVELAQLLVRVRETRTQTRLDPEARARNVHRAFEARTPRDRVPGRAVPTVILVDDVLTTGGSVLEATAAVREEAGADVAGVLILVDREEGGRERLEAEGLEVVSLFKRADFSILTK